MKPYLNKWGIIAGFLFAGWVVYLFFAHHAANDYPEYHFRRGITRPLAGKDESCMECHGQMKGFVQGHNPEVIGCTSCHLGNHREKDKHAAHKGMVLIPGNLNDMYGTCGMVGCHDEISHRVEHSLMNTMNGVVVIDQWVFGELDQAEHTVPIQDIGDKTASETHLRNLCASCHLGNRKLEAGPVSESSRGGGCNACHLQYSDEAKADFYAYHQDAETKGPIPRVHPALSVQVTDNHCFGCHSRSSRISSNFEGWHETRLPVDSALPGSHRVLEDGRVFSKMQADIHHQKGLSCIDCHHTDEIMGDGNTHRFKSEALKIACTDCHAPDPVPTVTFDGLDQEQQLLLGLRRLHFGKDRFVVSKKSGVHMYNVLEAADGQVYMVEKNSGKKHSILPPNGSCTNKAHQNLSCEACHTAWAPQCVGCHTAFNKQSKGFDLLGRKKTNGKWEEYLGVFFAEPPSLGVMESLDADSALVRQIKTFIPGMIMTLDQQQFQEGKTQSFHRLFAPVSAHTTMAKGRDCLSCHWNSLALGLGRGQISYNKGKWNFIPEYILSEQDQLPQDAWTGFLQNPNGVKASRKSLRPFNAGEQERILRVGLCLSCHTPDEVVMRKALQDFSQVWQARKPICDQAIVE